MKPGRAVWRPAGLLGRIKNFLQSELPELVVQALRGYPELLRGLAPGGGAPQRLGDYLPFAAPEIVLEAEPLRLPLSGA